MYIAFFHLESIPDHNMLRALDDVSALDRYIEIKSTIAELQEELETLKGPILFALMEEPEEKTQYKGFAMTIQRRKTYAYSPMVQDMESALKEEKEKERQNGHAEIVKHQAVLILKAQR